MSDDFNKYITTFDPCPRCGSAVESYEARPEYVRSNPSAVVSIPDPNCPHESDPEADCTCRTFINPYPDPVLENTVRVWAWVTFGPCGHVFEQGELRSWKVTRTLRDGWHQAQLDRLLADAAKHGVTLAFP